MTASAVIAIAMWAVFVAWIIACLIKDWREDARRARETAREARLLVLAREPVWIAGDERFPLYHLEAGMHRTLADILSLDEVHEVRS